MPEYEIEIPGADGWAVSMAIVQEFVRTWRAEVVEYDVSAKAGVITLKLPRLRSLRVSQTMARLTRSGRTLAASQDVFHRSLGVAARTAALLGDPR